MHPPPLITQEKIQARVAELGHEIAHTLRPGPILAVGILRGAFIFMADLVRAIPREVSCDFMRVQSYGAATTSLGEVTFILNPEESLEGQHILLIEDIVDTGLTIHRIQEIFRGRHPASLSICALLDKPSRRQIPVQVDYVGFEIPDRFVVGYGLDHNQRYRNLAYIAALDSHPEAAAPTLPDPLRP